jgi:hypothetical protein
MEEYMMESGYVHMYKVHGPRTELLFVATGKLGKEPERRKTVQMVKFGTLL